MVTLLINTIDGSVTGLFATYSYEATWAIMTCLLIALWPVNLLILLVLFTLLFEMVIIDI